MNIEDKIQQILNAYKSGMQKKKIDPTGNGSSVKTLLKGGKPTVRKIEQMYINVLTHQKQEVKANELSLSLAPSESLNRYQKEAILIQAIQAGIPKDKINPTSHGGSIKRLLEGKRLRAQTINDMYRNLLDHLGYSDNSSDSSEEQFYKQKIKSLEMIVLSLTTQIQTLESQLQSLQTQFKSFSHLPQPDSKAVRKISGLTIIQKTDIVKGRSYKRWYAIYKKDRKRHFLYIGKDLANAQQKIKSALARLGVLS